MNNALLELSCGFESVSSLLYAIWTRQLKNKDLLSLLKLYEIISVTDWRSGQDDVRRWQHQW